jgi:hypothetical protein
MKRNISSTCEPFTGWRGRALKDDDDPDATQPSIALSKDGKIVTEDERTYSDYLKFKDVSALIRELGILKYELKFFEMEIGSLPRQNAERARKRKERTFKNICAVEQEIAKRMNGRIPV